jgi:hypothetical protein
VNVNNEFVVGIPIEEAWTAMLDLERIAPCLPGASIDDQDGHEYKGTMRVKVGPITAKYQGTVRYEEVDERSCTPRDATPAYHDSSWRCSPLRSWPVPLGSPDRSRP